MKFWKEINFDFMAKLFKKSYDNDVKYCNVVSAFDLKSTKIETNTNVGPISFMYIWQMGIEDEIFYGRTWEDFRECLAVIKSAFKLNSRYKMVIYDQNMKYDFSFFKTQVSISTKHFLARSSKDVIKCIVNECFEFRDSACYTELRLEDIGRKIGIPKVEGYDYDKVRVSKTPLSDIELKYCETDILILLEYYKRERDFYKYIGNIPLTATQKVKKLIWKNYNDYGGKPSARSRKLKDNEKDKSTLNLLRIAYWGAYNWYNPIYTGYEINNALSIDLDSAYAGLAITQKFPMKKFQVAPIPEDPKSLIGSNQYSHLITLKITELKNKYPFIGYFPAYKSKDWKFDKKSTVIEQGKILYTKSIILTITEVDLELLYELYDFESIEILNVLSARKSYMPSYIVHSIVDMYIDKKSQKALIREQRKKGINPLPWQELLYVNAKTNVSRIYGAFVQDPEPIIYKYEESAEDITSYGNTNIKKAPEIVYYPWGVWITAYCRREMLMMLKKIAVETTHGTERYKKDSVLYIDTDCLKVLESTPLPKEIIAQYNENVKNKIDHLFENSLIKPQSIDGIGEFDIEFYKQIKILGSKMYAYIDEKDKFVYKVSGLSKENKLFNDKTPSECMELLDLEMDLTPEIAKNKKCDYITWDEYKNFEVTDYLGNTETVSLKSFAIISNTGYKTDSGIVSKLKETNSDKLKRNLGRRETGGKN